MRKRLLLMVALLAALTAQGQWVEQTVSLEVTSGQTLWFQIMSNGTARVSQPPSGNTLPAGDVVVPSEIEVDSTVYPVTAIGDWAFSNCNAMTSINLPGSITSCGNSAFGGCTSLLRTLFNGLVADWCVIDFSTSSSNPLYYAHKLYIDSVLITDLVIPNGVTEVKAYAFNNCSALQNIYISNTVTTIKHDAFAGCDNIGLVQLGNAVDSVEYGAFACDIQSLHIGSSLSLLGSGYSATYVYVDSIEHWLKIEKLSGFYERWNGEHHYGARLYVDGQMLTDIVIPEGTTEIKPYAFDGIEFNSVSIPSSVESIGSNGFAGVTGKYPTIFFNAANCDMISSGTFSASRLVVGPDVQNVPGGLCRSADAIVFDAAITSLGNDVFVGCTNRPSQIVMQGPPPSISAFTLDELNSWVDIVVPCGLINMYRQATGWSLYADNLRSESFHVELDNGVSDGECYYEGGYATLEQAACGEPATVTAYPDECWHFVRWSDGSFDNPHTLVPNYDMVIHPVFEYGSPFDVWIVYDTVEWEDWSREGYADANVGNCDSTAELTASPSCGYMFSHWYCLNDGTTYTDNPLTIKLTDYMDFMPVFTERPHYEVTAESIFEKFSSYEDGCYVHVGGEYCVDNVTLYPHADCGYEFSHWEDGSTDNPREVTPTSDTHFVAYFDRLQIGYIAEAVSSDSTLGWTAGSGWYRICYEDRHDWNEAELYAVPFGAVVFSGWSNGSKDNPLVITLESDTVVTALFSPISAADSGVVHDTTVVRDTVFSHTTDTLWLTSTDTMVVRDTVYSHTTDTLWLTNTDTMVVRDTVFSHTTDTLWLTSTDTMVVRDTVFSHTTDTLWLTSTDTIIVHDTAYIHDTIYVDHSGIGDAEAASVKLYQRDGRVVVECDGDCGHMPEVALYDAVGRQVAVEASTGAARQHVFEVPSSGVYIVRIGTLSPRRVVVVK